jgi:hypothetical protein
LENGKILVEFFDADLAVSDILRLAVVPALQGDAVSATEGSGPAGLAVVDVPTNWHALC